MYLKLGGVKMELKLLIGLSWSNLIVSSLIVILIYYIGIKFIKKIFILFKYKWETSVLVITRLDIISDIVKL